jgi:hypothetical protein
VERHGGEVVGQRLLVPAGVEPGVSSWGRGDLLVQRLWTGQEAGRRVEARCGHEGLRMLLSSRHGAGVHSHVPLPRVTVGRPRCIGPAVRNVGGGRWSGQKSHHGLHRHDRYCSFCCGTWAGCHWRCRCRHWAGKTAWKMTAWPLGTQRWCRASLGQLETRYCPCESSPRADHSEL